MNSIQPSIIQEQMDHTFMNNLSTWITMKTSKFTPLDENTLTLRLESLQSWMVLFDAILKGRRSGKNLALSTEHDTHIKTTDLSHD